jgi:hypothetical protein
MVLVLLLSALQHSKAHLFFLVYFLILNAVEEGVVEGKLQCVKCEARLGNFNWSGMQCSCGAWVTPAFQLHKSRMDAAFL